MTRSAVRILILLLPIFVISAAATSVTAAQAPPSTFLPIHETGADWAEDEYAPAVAFGDIDGDGLDEIAVSRRATTGARVLLFDDEAAGFAPLWSYGEGWGVASWATALAFGNVDDDPAEELVITRIAAVNERVRVFDDAAAGFVSLVHFGTDWSPPVSAVGAAFGDVDGDGRDELGFVTNAVEGDRILVYDDAAAAFAPLWAGDTTWGATAIATGIAFGDADGDGLDELAVTRNHTINARVYLYDDAVTTPPGFGLLWQYGQGWGAGSYATGVAFGNVDNDPAEEIGVTRLASLNERAYLFDDGGAGFALLQKFGESWAANAWASAMAFGDIDGDGRDEIGLARVATINPRVFVYDDAMPGEGGAAFAQLWGGGADWPGEFYATSVAFGNVDGAAEMEMGVGRFADEGPRAWVLRRGWSFRLPFVRNSGEPEASLP